MVLLTQKQYLKIGILLHHSLKQKRKTEIKRLLFCFAFYHFNIANTYKLFL